MALEMGSLFPETLTGELFNKVAGKSSLARLSQQIPVKFTGNREFTFSMDSEVDIVAESGKKSHGGVTVEPVTIVPVKYEYGARVSDEFMNASEEEQIEILKAFSEGFAKKLASGLDKSAMHGINPRTGSASAVIGTNHFDSKVTDKVVKTANIDSDIEDAIALIEGNDGEATGMIVSNTGRKALADLKNTANERLFPELAWGGAPATLNGLAFESNKTVGTSDVAIIGDFENAFKWGYAKDVEFEVIEFGDPDNTGKDLKGYNQVYLRGEAYIGWAIINPSAFARITVA